MDNPYQPPQAACQPPSPPAAGHLRPSRMVGQVQVVAILLMVEGSLEVLTSLLYAAIAVFVPFVWQQAAAQQGGANPPPPGMPWMMFGVYAGMGLIVLVGAALKCYAGWRNYRFRSRVLGLVALGSAAASLFSCYCSLTAIALAIYGFIVYLHEDVAQAFALGEQGVDPRHIKAAFAEPLPPSPSTP